MRSGEKSHQRRQARSAAVRAFLRSRVALRAIEGVCFVVSNGRTCASKRAAETAETWGVAPPGRKLVRSQAGRNPGSAACGARQTVPLRRLAVPPTPQSTFPGLYGLNGRKHPNAGLAVPGVWGCNSRHQAGVVKQERRGRSEAASPVPAYGDLSTSYPDRGRGWVCVETKGL